MRLQVFSDGVDLVVAESADDAGRVWSDYTSDPRTDPDYDGMEWEPLPDDRSLPIDDEGTVTTRTAGEWAAAGRRFLASSHY